MVSRNRKKSYGRHRKRGARTMTGLEIGLSSGLIALCSGVVGRLSNFRTVKKEMCEKTHTSLEKLFTEKLDNIHDKLETIEKKLP